MSVRRVLKSLRMQKTIFCCQDCGAGFMKGDSRGHKPRFCRKCAAKHDLEYRRLYAQKRYMQRKAGFSTQ